jgi:CheY-like chemotaxis protein
MTETTSPSEQPYILVAEDNSFDRMILQEAFDEVALNIELRFVTHGEELLDYLYGRNAYAHRAAEARPSIILMDLNMPRMNGHEALRHIRADSGLRTLPVLILSTSDSPAQITLAYDAGANAFMTKPGHFDDFVKLVENFGTLWFRFASLPAPTS